ncbi:TetR family transcriptional regulator [Cohnella caldifontis]|uniref:acyl-CoA-like ligand-binding transcription factor n=1 Tax=Cohnella caldifontis TaxID=3027471 RepID=UPI0023EE1BF4|nr:TetR family transcriptional regulator [Cohnella sp. YIM B05605]
MTDNNPPKLGLRERKKIKTRETIQQHALRLFREQGYHETTIEQIADAAEISPSTFFRYFPTKEAVVLEDDFDPLLAEAFREQPPELSPLQAFRSAVKTGFAHIPEEIRDSVRERMALTLTVPEIRAASLNQTMNTMKMIADLLAERTGRSPEDLYVLNFAGAIIGAFLSVQHYSFSHPDEDHIELFDRALAHLEAGMPL